MKYVLLLFGLLLSAQEKASFYFDFDQDTFNPKQNELFMSWLNKDQNREILVINGYCDWYGTFDYNDTLAYKRINTVQEQLKTKVNSSIFFSENIKIKGFGERVQTRKERRYNRRVDVFYKILPPKIVEKQVVYDDPVVYTGQIISREPEISDNDEIIQVPDTDDLIDPVGLYKNPYETAKVGDKLVMNNLYFYDRSGIFVPESLPVMEELLQFMVAHPKVKIEIQGHICCIDKDHRNLSTDRAKQIKRFLVYNGIPQHRIQTKGFGVSQPIYPIPEASEEQAAANRRVEIEILSK